MRLTDLQIDLINDRVAGYFARSRLFPANGLDPHAGASLLGLQDALIALDIPARIMVVNVFGPIALLEAV